MRIRNVFAAVAAAAGVAAIMSFSSLAAGWQHDNTGSWYQREDGSYPAQTWEQIDGAWYLFDQNGYKSEQADAGASMGHWEDCTFVNDWSNIRLTVPQDFTKLDSLSLSAQSNDLAAADMLSMKNKDCAIMILYCANRDGRAADEMLSFLNTFHGGVQQLEGGGKMETVTIGGLSYLRCYFPSSEEVPRCGYLYVRNMGSFYSMIAAVSDPANTSVMDSILSTLTAAH